MNRLEKRLQERGILKIIPSEEELLVKPNEIAGICYDEGIERALVFKERYDGVGFRRKKERNVFPETVLDIDSA